LSQDLNCFKHNYLVVLKKYQALPVLYVLNKKKIIDFKNYNFPINYIDSNDISKYVSKILIVNNSEKYNYLFVELYLNDNIDENMNFIDVVNNNLIINHSLLNIINNKYIVFSQDVNYLIPYSDKSYFNFSKPLLVSQKKVSIIKNTKKVKSNNFILIMFFIIILLIAIINFLYIYNKDLVKKYYPKKELYKIKKYINKFNKYYNNLKKKIIKKYKEIIKKIKKLFMQ
jgi:hypothetical protein